MLGRSAPVKATGYDMALIAQAAAYRLNVKQKVHELTRACVAMIGALRIVNFTLPNFILNLHGTFVGFW